MRERALRVLLVSTFDFGGGAERSASNLFRAYRARGLDAWMAVGRKVGGDPDVLVIPNELCRNRWARFCLKTFRPLAGLEQIFRGVWRLRLRRLWGYMREPARQWRIESGFEDFDSPGSWRLVSMSPKPPDLVHCFNLHGGYFDLRVLPWLSHQMPVILDLRDTWLLSGHCAFSLGCERWKTGCGLCPHLTIYPAVPRDRTDSNWRRKREIYAKSRLYIAAPCHWMIQKVQQSMLASAVVEARVIPTGMDLAVFHPAEKHASRAALGFPQEARVLLFVGYGIRRNDFKDYQTMRTAVALAAERLKGFDVRFIALGESAPSERIGRAVVTFVPFQRDPNTVAHFYRAADVYVHAASVDADTFPRAVLESLACGTPAVATAVCGIPEQIKGLRLPPSETLGFACYDSSEATGVLVPPTNAEAMAEGIQRLLSDDGLRLQLAENAAVDARQRFDLQRQVNDYLAWYEEIMTANEEGKAVGQRQPVRVE